MTKVYHANNVSSTYRSELVVHTNSLHSPLPIVVSHLMSTTGLYPPAHHGFSVSLRKKFHRANLFTLNSGLQPVYPSALASYVSVSPNQSNSATAKPKATRPSPQASSGAK